MNGQATPISTEHMRRLAFVRYLHNLAQQQADAPEPRSAVAILMLHDAVELFLQMAAEKFSTAKPEREFMRYFDAVPRLTMANSMRRLNQARIALKHAGVRPSRDDIAGLRGDVRIFLTENTPIIFGLNFAEVSMIDLVRPADVRDSLARSAQFFTAGDRMNALIEVARAFRQVVDAFSKRSHGVRALDNAAVAAESHFSLVHAHRRLEGDTGRILEEIMEWLRVMQDALMAQMLRQDGERYFRFQAMASQVRWFGDGSPIAPERRFVERLTPADLEFAIDFVTEAALELGTGANPAADGTAKG